MKPLPPPTDEERVKAREAAATLRVAIRTGAPGEQTTFHVDLHRPRCGQWWTTWSNLPGFTRVRCSRDGWYYTHDLLPGWTYMRAEIRAEMIPDLEALAERGERPTVATAGAR